MPATTGVAAGQDAASGLHEHVVTGPQWQGRGTGCHRWIYRCNFPSPPPFVPHWRSPGGAPPAPTCARNLCVCARGPTIGASQDEGAEEGLPQLRVGGENMRQIRGGLVLVFCVNPPPPKIR
jgi:hypothetical protein